MKTMRRTKSILASSLLCLLGPLMLDIAVCANSNSLNAGVNRYADANSNSNLANVAGSNANFSNGNAGALCNNA